MRAHHCSTAPEEGDEIPGQWTRDHGYVDKGGSGWVTEVDRGQVEEVEHEHKLGGPEMGADPEQQEGRLEYIVDNEVASDVGSSSNPLGVIGKEMPDVADLKDKERNPTSVSFSCGDPFRTCSLHPDSPVDISNEGIQGEWSAMMPVLAPDGVVVALLSIAGSIEAISDAEDKDEEPGEYCQGFVYDKGAVVVRLSLCERVH